MTKIRNAKSEDIEQINVLLKESNLCRIYPEQLSDICLVADDKGLVVGFIWAMVSAGNKIAYVDHFAIRRSHRGLGPKLVMAIMNLGKDLGIEDVISYVRDDGLMDSLAAFKINIAAGLRPQTKSYHCFTGNLQDRGND